MAGNTAGELELDRYPLCGRSHPPNVLLELEEGEEVPEGVRGRVQEEEVRHAAGVDMIILPKHAPLWDI